MSVTHECWGCGSPFVRPIGPGRPPRWCTDRCRNADRATRKRLAAAERRETEAAAYRARREATLIQRYGPEGAAALLRVGSDAD